jgi:alpha-beta hydrolase superfamily lysophospholipase
MNKVPTDDRQWLHLRRWPLQGPAHGVIVIVHGLGEHTGRYVMLAQFLNQLGWHVMGCDLRGHGVSEGKRGQIPRADTFLTDLAQVIDQVRDEFPGRLLLLGHSLGGLITARFVAEAMEKVPALWSRPVDGLVLSSPALDPGMRIVQKMMLATFGRLMPAMSVGNGLKSTWISRERAVVRGYQRDRMVHDRASPRIVRFILDGARVVQMRAPKWPVPTLLMWAGADRCVAPRGSAAFAEAAPPEMVQSQEYPALYHEIFNEPERAEVLARLASWLRAFKKT